MLTIVGNGPSRLKYDLNEIGEWWGCNRIYTDATPDLLFAGDIDMQAEIIHEQKYYYNNKLFMGGFEWLDMSMWDMIKFGFAESHDQIREFRHPEDTLFCVQGNQTYADLLGYNPAHSGNIIMYNNLLLRNLFTGMVALGYACESGRKEVELAGFDALDPSQDSVGNVYEGSKNYEPYYTKQMRVYDAQRSQFIALLKHFSDVKVYWKKSLDERELIDYNELPYYINNREWLLGIGFADDQVNQERPFFDN
tara:strand:- start:613 stop:1365 length:753 start_codon:yes stop_codon:yes gene_type:complete